jgi:hypothetical protein
VLLSSPGCIPSLDTDNDQQLQQQQAQSGGGCKSTTAAAAATLCITYMHAFYKTRPFMAPMHEGLEEILAWLFFSQQERGDTSLVE